MEIKNTGNQRLNKKLKDAGGEKISPPAVTVLLST